jgi:PKD repeat protein
VGLAVGLAGALDAGAVTNVLSTVAPSSAPQGTNGLLVTFTLSAFPPAPPTNVAVTSVTMGELVGASPARPLASTVTALFSIPPNATPGARDVRITFQGTNGFVALRTNAFTVTAAPLAADFTALPTAGAVPLTVTFTDASSGIVSNRSWSFGDGGTSTNANPVHTYTNIGAFTASLTVTGDGGSSTRVRTNCVTTTAATNGPWRFAVFSDTHATNDVGVLPEIAQSVVADGVKLVLCAGDIADGGLGATPAELESQLLLWRNAMGPVYSNGIAVYVLRGNHEDDVANDVAVWTNVFSGPYACPGNGPAGESNLTYSFTYRNALFVGMDDYVNLHRVNQAWLDQQLAANTRPHVFPVGHEAAFKVFHGDCLGSYPTERNAFWSSLAAAGARAYFCGHDHFFNVARIDDGDGNASNDLYQCEVGTSGGWFMASYNYNGTNTPYTPVNVQHVTNAFGYLLVEISGSDLADRDVTMTWKQRTFDTNTSAYVYLATTSIVRYTAPAVVSTGTNPAGAYLIVDTGQTNCYHESAVIAPPAPGQGFYGQDGQVFGNQPGYRDNGDGTVSDLNTGLMWVQARGTQVAWAAAVAGASNCTVGGYTDWRMPTMKELYSLVKFTGANGSSLTNAAGYLPFLDTNYFGFSYGGTSTNIGSRIIDAQDWSANAYVSTVINGQAAAFGFNFTDGRIKGYPPANGNYVRYVRGNPAYGVNLFTHHGDGTVTDLATGLMWPRDDNGVGMTWSNALAWVQSCNATNYLGYHDWRLPNAKELHSLFDYTRAPATSGSAAIVTNLNCTVITNEAGEPDFPWYWTGTTLIDGPNSAGGVYLCFGRAMAYMNGNWIDAHGAGAQRSDPKGGSLTNNPKYTYVPNGYYAANAPQGDAIRILNFVRPVRGGTPSALDSVGDGIPDWWRRQWFGGAGTTTSAASCAAGDADDDGMVVREEYLADTDPTDPASRLAVTDVVPAPAGVQVYWTGGTSVTQVVEFSPTLLPPQWIAVATSRPPTPVINSWLQGGETGGFLRIRAGR